MKGTFENIGGKFLIPENEFRQKLNLVKAFVFDWDGVFTDGSKDFELQSRFNEVDSMGTNLLRFSFYLKNKALPFTSVISGENNKAAFTFVKRECFHSCYYKMPNKIEAAQHFCKANKINLNQIAFVFDDVLDLSLAEKCGLRIFIPRKQNPLLNQYIIKNNLADYLTSDPAYAVRESCELLMGLYDLYDEALKHRTAYSDTYKSYLELRKATETEFFTCMNGVIEEGNF